MPYIKKPDTLRIERAKGWLADVRGLAPSDLQSVVIQFTAALASTSPVTDDYKVPGDSDLAILGVHGFLRMPTLNSEPTAILGWLNLPPTERFLIKAQNCTVSLDNQDRKHKYFDNHDIPLAAIMPPCGYPVIWPPEAPGIVPRNETLRATFTLQDSTAAIVGNSTVYGLAVTGVLVPRED